VFVIFLSFLFAAVFFCPLRSSVTREWALAWDLFLFVGWSALTVFGGTIVARHIAALFNHHEPRFSRWTLVFAFALLFTVLLVLDLTGRMPMAAYSYRYARRKSNG
jgi:hypothetical protein